MGFFRKRRLGQTERLEAALKDRQGLRQDLSRRLNTAEMFVADKREVSERLALDGASDDVLGRAEAKTRAAEDRARTLRAALARLEEQIAEIERELGAAVERRYRDTVADTLDAMVAAITQTVPKYEAAAATLVEAVTKSAGAVPEATAFAADLDAVRREVSTAVALICAELRAAAAHARSGEAEISFRAPVSACSVQAPQGTDSSAASETPLGTVVAEQITISDLFEKTSNELADASSNNFSAKVFNNDTAAAA